MTHEPPPMSPALRALVDADNRRPGPSDGVRAGVYAALGLGAGVIPAGALAAAHAASTAATATTAATAAAPVSATATAVGALGVVGRLALIAKAPLVGVGLGAVLGASVMAYVAKRPVGASHADARRPVAAAVAPARGVGPAAPEVAAAAPEERPAPPETVLDAPPAPRAIRSSTAALPRHLAADLPAGVSSWRLPALDAAHASAPRADGAHALAAEQALLDPARAAIARGDGAAALADLDAHERRFPGGALSQEREAMAIRALVLTGDRARAERRAASFRARFPGSVLQPMLDAALRSRP